MVVRLSEIVTEGIIGEDVETHPAIRAGEKTVGLLKHDGGRHIEDTYTQFAS